MTNSQPRYRVVHYFYQWPIGNKQKVLGADLSLQEAEKLRNAQPAGAENEDIVIEKMGEVPEEVVTEAPPPEQADDPAAGLRTGSD